MGDLKWITQKEFEAYLRVKEFIEKNSYEEADLKKKFEMETHSYSSNDTLRQYGAEEIRTPNGCG